MYNIQSLPSSASPVVCLRIDGAPAVETAVQLLAQGVGVALLLEGQFPPFRPPPAAPPRPVVSNAASEAHALLCSGEDVDSAAFLQAAARLFGVARWPEVVGGGRKMPSDPFAPRFVELLKAHGIQDYTFVRGAKHPRLVINHQGVTKIYAYPGTSGDRRAPLNAVSDLKHLLGLVSRAEAPKPKKIRRHQKVRRQKALQAAAVRLTEFCEVEDRYFGPLEALRLRLLAAEVQAADVLISSGAPSPLRQKPRQRLRCPFLGLNRVRYQEPA